MTSAAVAPVSPPLPHGFGVEALPTVSAIIVQAGALTLGYTGTPVFDKVKARLYDCQWLNEDRNIWLALDQMQLFWQHGTSYWAAVRELGAVALIGDDNAHFLWLFSWIAIWLFGREKGKSTLTAVSACQDPLACLTWLAASPHSSCILPHTAASPGPLALQQLASAPTCLSLRTASGGGSN